MGPKRDEGNAGSRLLLRRAERPTDARTGVAEDMARTQERRVGVSSAGEWWRENDLGSNRLCMGRIGDWRLGAGRGGGDPAAKEVPGAESASRTRLQIVFKGNRLLSAREACQSDHLPWRVFGGVG
jgi:hypothetical protein